MTTMKFLNKIIKSFRRKKIQSFLIRLERFGDFPVICHIREDDKMECEFDPDLLPNGVTDNQIFNEINQIISK